MKLSIRMAFILVLLALTAGLVAAEPMHGDVKVWGQDCQDFQAPYAVDSLAEAYWSSGTRYMYLNCLTKNRDGEMQIVWWRSCVNRNPKSNSYPTATQYKLHISCWEAP